jgi:hypothetical protein
MSEVKGYENGFNKVVQEKCEHIKWVFNQKT